MLLVFDTTSLFGAAQEDLAENAIALGFCDIRVQTDTFLNAAKVNMHLRQRATLSSEFKIEVIDFFWVSGCVDSTADNHGGRPCGGFRSVP